MKIIIIILAHRRWPRASMIIIIRTAFDSNKGRGRLAYDDGYRGEAPPSEPRSNFYRACP